MKTLMIAGVGVALCALAACSKEDPTPTPQGSDVAAAMPDTAAARNPDMRMTAPDAGATGVAPADGSAPAVAATPPVGTAGASPGVSSPTTDQIPPKP